MYYTIRYILFAFTLFHFSCSYNDKSLVNDFESKRIGNYELRMELAKEVYYEMEPVLAKFTLINHDSLPLILNNHFSSEKSSNIYLIYSGKNITNSYINSKYSLPKIYCEITIDTVSQYIVNPSDTFYISIPINNWGFKYEFESLFKLIFKKFGYFTKGRYNFRYAVLNKKYIRPGDEKYTEIESNNVQMKIRPNAPEDYDILNKITGKMDKNVYKELIVKYPKSIYREHLLMSYIYYMRSETDIPGIICEYEKFISEYPNSYYLLNEEFISYYIYLLIKDHNNLYNAQKFINEKITNKLLHQYISNDKRLYNMIIHNLY